MSVYNLSAVNGTTTALGFMQEINNLTDKILVMGFGVVLFVIIFSLIESRIGDMRKALLGSAFISFILNGVFFLAGGLVEWYIVLVYLVLIAVAILMLRDKDTGG